MRVSNSEKQPSISFPRSEKNSGSGIEVRSGVWIPKHHFWSQKPGPTPPSPIGLLTPELGIPNMGSPPSFPYRVQDPSPKQEPVDLTPYSFPFTSGSDWRSYSGAFMEGILEAIYEEDTIAGGETLDDISDVEMLDVETVDGSIGSPPSPDAAPPPNGGGGEAGGGPRSRNKKRRGKKKKNKSKSSSSKERDRSTRTVSDINRFVVNACRRLREKKSYLVWNAIGCLGVDAVYDIVKEVDVIQGCGGQITADGRRFRSGGGILWNILKTREPKAYKQIMKKGREFEKQFRLPKNKGIPNMNQEVACPNKNVPDGAAGAQVAENSETVPNAPLEPAFSDPSTGRKSALDRIRVPVAYDDLFEEGEIQERTQVSEMESGHNNIS